MNSTNYPKDWYKYLVKGDVVQCIKSTHPLLRKEGDILTIHNKSEMQSIRYISREGNKQASKKYNEFIPIKMKFYPDLNVIDYEIF